MRDSSDIRHAAPRDSDPLTSTLFLAAVAVGCILRVWVSTLGHNDDFRGWMRTAEIASAGENVYAHTGAYNYGPIWAYLLVLIKWVDAALGIQHLHGSIAAFLSVVDIGLALMLVRVAGYAAAVLFILSPVSILLTGFHSQFDNLAVLIAAWSWSVFAWAPVTPHTAWRQTLRAAVLMGASLASKHILIFFPLWVLFVPHRPITHRLVYCGVAYACLVAAFVPFALTPEGLLGIQANVIGYRSDLGAGFFPHLVRLLVPPHLVARLSEVSGMPATQALWAVTMVGTGIIIARKFPRELLFAYLVALLAYTPAMAEQYLAIPLFACAFYWRHWQSWLYLVVATALLSASPVNIGAFPGVSAYTGWLRNTGLFNFHKAQLCMLLLLLAFYYRPGVRGAQGVTGRAGTVGGWW